MELTGCGPMEAARALAQHGDLVLAVGALLTKPVVSGEKYIPKRPTVDPGMTTEQKERCDKGRWLQDQVNAVFSVAHSQTRSDPLALESLPQEPIEILVPTVSEAQSPSTTSLSQGSDEKSPRSDQQPEPPQ
jgi:hypothetical protein